MTKILSGSKVSSMVIGANIPDGATATPVDDYRIWLRCAGLPNTYGSLANVIADTTAMETLCNNLNALRYMVRSTSTIMPAVLANGDWLTALDGSAYAVKFPTMTSNTAPSGVATATASEANAYKAFDNDSATHFYQYPTNDGVDNVQYSPSEAYIPYRWLITLYPHDTGGTQTEQGKLQSYVNGAWIDISDVLTMASDTPQTFTGTCSIGLNEATSFRCLAVRGVGGPYDSFGVDEMQVYGLNLL